MKTIARYFTLFLCLMLSHLGGLAQSQKQYPDLNKHYTKQQMQGFLDEYQKKQDTLGMVYTYALWKANMPSFNPDEDKKVISTIYKYKDRVKKYVEEDYYFILLDLAVYHNGDYKSLTNSIALCDSVLLYAQKKGNKSLRRKALTSKAYMLMDKNETQDIFKILNELYTYRYQWKEVPFMQSEYYYILGFSYLKTKRYEQSIRCFQKVLKLSDPEPYLIMRHLSILFLAQNYRLSGNLKEATRYALLGLDMTKGINNIHLERWAYEELALINHAQKNYQTEGNYWLQYWQAEQAIRVLNISKLNRSGVNFELLEAELREANFQKQLALSDNKQKQLLSNGLLIICGLLILLLGVATWAYYQRVRIAHQQKQMALYEGQEQERNLIARELHDNIGSTLAGIKTQLDPNSSNFGLLTTHLDNLYQNVRTLSHVLHAEDIEQVGLQQSCQDFIQLIDKNGLIVFAVYGQEALLSPLETKIIYRIIQELLTNALKHAKATKIYLNLLFEAKQLMISVEDNGIGFNTGLKLKGFGIKNIHKRIKTLNGYIQIDTSSEGSSFLIVIPFGKVFSEYPK